MDLENIEKAIWPTLHPWRYREQYVEVARSLPKPFRQVMRLDFEIEVHSPSLFLYRDVPFYGCAVGNSAIIIVRIDNSHCATMVLRDVPGYENTVSKMSITFEI